METIDFNIQKDASLPVAPFLKNKPHYPVYVVKPENLCSFSWVMPFTHNKVMYLWSEFDKKVYAFTEGEEYLQMQDLDMRVTPTVSFENGKIYKWKTEFSEAALAHIGNAEKTKLNDRSYEKSHSIQSTKYNPQNGANILIMIIIICVGVFLVLWVIFGGLPNLITTINDAAKVHLAANQAAVLNQTFKVG